MVKNRSLFLRKLAYFFHPAKNAEEYIVSPNGKIICRFLLRQGHISYSVSFMEKTIIKESRLGISMKDETDFREGLSLVRLTKNKFDESWETIVGEEKTIRNHYNEKAFYLEENNGEKRLITIRFRVFDDGVAFRYEIPPQNSFSRIAISDELTEFNVGADSTAWEIPANQPDRYEYNYEKKSVFELFEPVHTPLTIKSKKGPYISIHEAALYNYGEMTLKLDEWRSLKSDICPLSDGIKAYVELPFSTPWRAIIIAEKAIDLPKSRMILNLNEKPKSDFSWVRPLKFFGIWWAMYVGEWTWAPGERHGATTKNTLDYIDYCKKFGIRGLLVEGWNDGWEGDWLQNGKNTNFTKAASDFDIEKITEEAQKHGIEFIAHHETVGFVDNYEKQLEEAYGFCSEHGIKYLKSGYAGSSMMINGKKEFHHSQLGVLHYQNALELAAKYHIMLDVHEPIKGTGIERTWPNLLTREGARGQEYEGGAISPSHATFLPFTRLLAGGMDYTSGIFDITNGAKRLASTLARQLALLVTIPSGMQMLADRPKIYAGEHKDAFKFLQDVPVNWEESIPLVGEIGEYYVVARKGRDEENWYIGGITDSNPRNFELNLYFLEDEEYEAEIYRDGEKAHFRDNPMDIRIEKRFVRKNDKIRIFVASGGGFAIRIAKL